MLKFCAVMLGVAAAGVIVASPAIAAGLMSPTLTMPQTRAASSLSPSVALAPASTSFATSRASGDRRQSPIIVFGSDSPG